MQGLPGRGSETLGLEEERTEEAGQAAEGGREACGLEGRGKEGSHLYDYIEIWERQGWRASCLQ